MIHRLVRPCQSPLSAFAPGGRWRWRRPCPCPLPCPWQCARSARRAEIAKVAAAHIFADPARDDDPFRARRRLGQLGRERPRGGRGRGRSTSASVRRRAVSPAIRAKASPGTGAPRRRSAGHGALAGGAQKRSPGCRPSRYRCPLRRAPRCRAARSGCPPAGRDRCRRDRGRHRRHGHRRGNRRRCDRRQCGAPA